jgi:hypothetical protein
VHTSCPAPSSTIPDHAIHFKSVAWNSPGYTSRTPHKSSLRVRQFDKDGKTKELRRDLRNLAQHTMLQPCHTMAGMCNASLMVAETAVMQRTRLAKSNCLCVNAASASAAHAPIVCSNVCLTNTRPDKMSGDDAETQMHNMCITKRPNQLLPQRERLSPPHNFSCVQSKQRCRAATKTIASTNCTQATHQQLLSLQC